MKSIPPTHNNHPWHLYSKFLLVNHSHMYCPRARWGSGSLPAIQWVNGKVHSGTRAGQVQDQWPHTHDWCAFLWTSPNPMENKQHSDNDCSSHLFSAVSSIADERVLQDNNRKGFSKQTRPQFKRSPQCRHHLTPSYYPGGLFGLWVFLYFNPCPSLSSSSLCPCSSWRPRHTPSVREAGIPYKRCLISVRGCQWDKSRGEISSSSQFHTYLRKWSHSWSHLELLLFCPWAIGCSVCLSIFTLLFPFLLSPKAVGVALPWGSQTVTSNPLLHIPSHQASTGASWRPHTYFW